MDDLQLINSNFKNCSWPHYYYGVVPFLLRGRNQRNVAEIGVAYGYHALSILHSLPEANYYGIDPYLPDYDEEDGFCLEVSRLFSEQNRSEAMRRLGDAVTKSLSGYGPRATLIRKKSHEAADDFTNGFFDLIFIDGDHTYEGVKSDLNCWWPKVSEGGVLCGDDWRSFEGVRVAVNEFTELHGLQLKSTEKPGTNNPIWLIEK